MMDQADVPGTTTPHIDKPRGKQWGDIRWLWRCAVEAPGTSEREWDFLDMAGMESVQWSLGLAFHLGDRPMLRWLLLVGSSSASNNMDFSHSN
jgi:hypothetical protein